METEKSVKKEFRLILLSLVLFFVLLKIIFYKEEIINILKLSSSIFFLFFLPYFLIMYVWLKELNIAERMIFAIICGLAINGIFSYYLGLIGFDLSYNYVIIAVVTYSIGILIAKKSFVEIEVK